MNETQTAPRRFDGLWWQLPETRFERELHERGETPPHLRRPTSPFDGLKPHGTGYSADHECERCGALFTASSASAKFCSQTCKQRARLTGRTSTCEACGEEFTHRSDARPRFCSPMCVGAGTREEAAA